MTTPTTVNVRLQLRADTAANWTAANPTLLANEVGLETDTKKLKVGNGSSAWNSLAYFPSIVSGGTVLGNLEIGTTGTLTFEGSTADGFETTLAVTNPTADRTITLPNQSGTVVVSGNASIVDADIAANAEIAVSKLADGAARQLLQTDAAGTGVEWTSNVDIPGMLDVTGPATFDGAVTIGGDLTVNGTTTNINTQNLVVEDKNIILGDVPTPSDVTADGGGVTLKGATDKTINWVDSTDAWTSSERFSIPLGSAASPSLTFTGDENTGIYSPGADQVAISTGGSGRLFVNSDGTVSVGNALTPTGITSLGLRVSTNTGVGNVLVLSKSSDGTNPPNLTFCKSRGTAASPTAVTVNDVAGSVFGTAYDGSTHQTIAGLQYGVESLAGSNDISGNIQFQTRSSGVGAFTQERLRITSAGLVGVGTSAPQTQLQVGNGGGTGAQATAKGTLQISAAPANLTNAGGLEFKTSEFGSGYGWKIAGCADGSANPLIIGNRDNSATWSPRLFISAGGNVGIGTTSPTTPLEVSGTSAQIRVIDSAVDMRVLPLAGGQAGIFGTASNHSLVLWTNSTERVRLDSSGRLLVGTSSAYAVEGFNRSHYFNPLSGDNSTHVVLGGAGTGGFPALYFARTRAASANLATTAVQNADLLGSLRFFGANGTDFSNTAATIECLVDGEPFTSGDTTDLPGRLVFSTTPDSGSSPVERMRIRNDGTIYFNTGGGGPSGAQTGSEFNTSGYIFTSTSGVAAAYFNRNTNDGTLVELRQDNVAEGTISVSGTTVSYNGAHLSRWSQLPSGAERIEILRGTVLSNIDEMCEWGDEENEQLNRMKVSDVEGDKNVSGVFQAWDDDDDTYTNDFYCAMTGDFIIRIAQGVTVERGDLLMSAGDGTAKPQDDDIIRSKTIAKVTSTNVSCTYDDGSYCVPCVLMAC